MGKYISTKKLEQQFLNKIQGHEELMEAYNNEKVRFNDKVVTDKLYVYSDFEGYHFTYHGIRESELTHKVYDNIDDIMYEIIWDLASDIAMKKSPVKYFKIVCEIFEGIDEGYYIKAKYRKDWM